MAINQFQNLSIFYYFLGNQTKFLTRFFFLFFIFYDFRFDFLIKIIAIELISPSRSSFSNSPFSNFGSYMVEKNRKLQNQFEAEASTSSHGGSGSVKPIFDGVSIFVDGFTVPSSQLALIWDQALGKFVLQTGQMKSSK